LRLSSSEINVREQLSEEFGRLAHQRASGALEIGGERGATVFLSGGYLTYAESPCVPDLRSRLISSQRLSGSRWSQVSVSARAHGSIGGLLVGSEIIADSELRDLLWSITLDALIALALPLSAAGPSPVEIRFWPRTSHLIGSYLRLDLASAWAAAGQKAELLARSQTVADARPLLTGLHRPWAVLSSEQWALAWQIDGRATIKDLAWQNGFALCDTTQWVEDLIQAGLCVVAAAGSADAARKGSRARERANPRHATRPKASDATSGEGEGKGEGELSAPANEAAALPHRNPGASLAAPSAKPRAPVVVPQWRPADIKKPPETSHSDLLHRILRGLKRA
jgi:hypothetical protein